MQSMDNAMTLTTGTRSGVNVNHVDAMITEVPTSSRFQVHTESEHSYERCTNDKDDHCEGIQHKNITLVVGKLTEDDSAGDTKRRGHVVADNRRRGVW